MLERLSTLVYHLCHKWNCEVIEFNREGDHVHLLFRYYPQMELSQFVHALKSYTSMMRRKEFPTEIRKFYWGKPIFWSPAYFIASCGGVTVDVLKRYVQEQGKSSD